MKTFFKIICLLTFAVSISGCNVFCTEGEGSIETETRNLEDFKSIVLDVSADVTVVKGQPAKAEIETYRNLLEKIETKTSRGRLKITSDGCVSAGEKIKIKITLPQLEGLEINGSGNIIVPDTFTVDKLNLEIN